MTALCYNFATDEVPNGRAWRGFSFVTFQHSRGVAQPGRAPGSGPGGRRFKSSLPDQLFPSNGSFSQGRNQAVRGAEAGGTRPTSLPIRIAGYNWPTRASAMARVRTAGW